MRLIVQGQAPLQGNYPVSGNSNEAIALIAASLLSAESFTFKNVPKTSAVRNMLDSAHDLGTEVTWQDHELSLYTPKVASRQVGKQYTHNLLGSILFLAPLLARREHAILEWESSLNRLYTHLTAMRDLGLRVDMQGQTINVTAQRWRHKEITLMESSVTATALVCMLAASLGDETIVYNAASEPHIRSLQTLLMKMGVKVEGSGSNLLRIIGNPDGLHGAEHSVQPDHIEIASIAAIAAITPGHITIDPIIASDLHIISKVYERLGVGLVLDSNKLHLYDRRELVIDQGTDLTVDTSPWPGFPSDLIAIATVLATQSNGTTLIHEKLYNNRLLFVDKLKGMGAQIVLADPHRAVVIGATELRGEYMDTPDVRIGLALLAAALCANGESVIDRAEIIGRNFEDVVNKLIQLGAAIEVQH